MSGQSGGQRLRLSTLNEALTCKLCGGYFIDATSIIECLHSFCKSCIVKYLENNKHCPVCNIQVHKNKPLLNIRPDQMLQDVVYKLVPGCYQNEMRKRKEFYDKLPEDKSQVTSPEARGEPDESYIYSPDESLSLSLEYYTPENGDDIENDKEDASKHLPKRYLRCPAAVTVFHLQKLIRAKYGLSEAHRVDIMYKEEPLSANYTLMDIMYIYHWRRKVPLHLSYRIFESASKRLKMSDDNDEFKQSLLNSNIEFESKDNEQSIKREWKEVQLKISETGVMSVTDISNLDAKNSTKGNIANQQSGLDQAGLNISSVNKTVVKEEKESAKCTASSKGKKAQQETNRKNEQNSNTKSNTTSASKREEMEVKSIDQRDLSNELLKSENENKQSKVSSSSTNKNQAQQAPEKIKAEATSTPEKSEVKQNATTNNNVINNDTKSEATAKPNAKPTPSAGSKINALSAKLQFQPKVGQVNNTYAKKSPAADKKAGSPTKVVDTKTQKGSPKPEVKLEEPSEVKPAVTSTPTYSRSSLLGSATPATYVTAPSDTSVKLPQHNDVLHSLGAPSTESLASIGLHVSTTMPGQVNLNNWLAERNAALKNCKNLSADQQLRSMPGMPHIGKDIVCSTTTVTTPSTLGRFNIQTPSMSIYSITSSKNNYSSPSKQPSPKQSSLDVTSMFPVPPCPDGIPISLMKSLNARKDVAKNLPHDKSARQSAGSKINDICAKIGESSKEKNKIESQRGKPEVPDLLKISKSPTSESSPVKHIPNIPNVPIYTPSNSHAVALSNEAKKIATSGLAPVMMSPPMQKMQPQKKHMQPVGYKTLRDPPKSWNPTLSKNNYVAVKNQAKELQNQTQTAYGVNDGSSASKQIPSKPAKIFKIKNMPRYLGNPASGVKPMYSVVNEQAKEKDQSTTSKNSPTMMKIDPQTLSPIVSSPNSPIVSPPPYSPTARSYQNSPFTRDIRNSNSPISPRNSPVNMLSTNPFIPSHTHNTNPRLIYSHFPPAHFADASRFAANPLIRSPIGIPTVNPSAFHSSLPPATNKLYQRSGYLAPQPSPAPTVQRVPPSSPSSKAKSPTSVVDSVAMQLAKGLAHNAFDLTRAEVAKSESAKQTPQPAHKSNDVKPKSSPDAKKDNVPATPKQNDTFAAKRSEPESKTTPASAAPTTKEPDKTDKTSAKVNGGIAETTPSVDKPKDGQLEQPSKEKNAVESKTAPEGMESKSDLNKSTIATQEREKTDAKKTIETQDKQEIKIDNSDKTGDSPAKTIAEQQTGKIES